MRFPSLDTLWNAARGSFVRFPMVMTCAIVGAVAAGFVLIPALGFAGTAKLAVVTNAVLALAAAVLWTRGSKVLVAVSAGAALLAAVLFRPSVPENLIKSSPFVEHRGGGGVIRDRDRQSVGVCRIHGGCIR